MVKKNRENEQNIPQKKKKMRKIFGIVLGVLFFIGLSAVLTYEKGSEAINCKYADCLFAFEGRYWFYLLGYKEDCSLLDLNKACYECSRKFLGFNLEKYNICK